MTNAEIAARLELVPTAVNYYFRRKEDLAAECYFQAIEHYNGLIKLCESKATAEGRLQSLLHGFADHLAAVDRGDASPVATFNDVRTIRNAAVNTAYEDMFRSFRRIFYERHPHGLSRLQRNSRTHLLISQITWAELWLRQYDPDDYRRMIDRLFDVLTNGLTVPGTVWGPSDLGRPYDLPTTPNGSREDFLHAAIEMINEHGYLGASVSRISARLNVTKGSFYHHNEAKDDLVTQCFEWTLRAMRLSQMAADARSTTGFDKLASLAASMVLHDVAGEVPLLRTTALTAVPEDMQAQLIRRFKRLSMRLASVVSDGIVDGSVRPVDPNVAAETLTALINASSELHHWSPGITPENVTVSYARPLFEGLFEPGQNGS